MIALFTLFTFLTVSSVANAINTSTHEDGARLKTTTNYYGIEGTFTIPSNIYVSNDGSYLAFYLGLGDICEGGISYVPSIGWKKALKCGSSPNNLSQPLDIQPQPGQTVHIKLVNNIGSATLYINGYEVTTIAISGLGGPTPVKMVHATVNHRSQNTYKNAKFSNVNVKTGTGTAAYIPFPSNVAVEYPFSKSAPNHNTLTNYVILNSNPLATNLNVGQ
jgi:hypothetical protein